MADVRAVKSGSWSDPTVWSTGALPTASDDVWANTYTVTIDTSPTVLSIRNGSTTNVTAGGLFVISANGITLTCTGGGILPQTTCLTVSVGAGSTCNVTSAVRGGIPGSSHGISHSGAGTLNVTGTITAGTNNNGRAIVNGSTGTVNVTGDCLGAQTGSDGTALAIINSSSGIVNITGNCTGGTSAAINNNSTGTVSITGTVTGGSGSTAYGALNSSTGTLTHVGTAQASATTPAIGPGASVGQVTILSGPLISTSTDQTSAAASGTNPCVALRWFPQDTALGTFELRMRGQTVSGGARPARQFFFPDAYSATYPAASNVRSSTTYGPGSIYTGTCAIPGAASVLTGVPVDNTTGTASAAFTAAGVRSAVGLASANLDSQLSTLATNTAPATIATAVRTELSPELARAANVATTQQLADIIEGAV